MKKYLTIPSFILVALSTTLISTSKELFQMMAPSRDSLKDCTSHCSSYKGEAHWRDCSLSLGSQMKLMRSLVISIFLYACDSPLRWDATEGYWTFPTRTMLPIRKFTERAKQPLENMMNSWPWSRKGNQDGLAMSHSGLAKTMLQGTVKGKRRWGRQKKRWDWLVGCIVVLRLR